jgi:hypothetical protein
MAMSSRKEPLIASTGKAFDRNFLQPTANGHHHARHA